MQDELVGQHVRSTDPQRVACRRIGVILLTVVGAGALAAGGCATPLDVSGPAQNTPYDFAANKVFYLEAPSGPNHAFRRLLSDAELTDRIRNERGALRELSALNNLAPARQPSIDAWRPVTGLAELRAMQSRESGLRRQLGIDIDTVRQLVAFAETLPMPVPTLTEIEQAYERDLVEHGDPLAVLVSGVRVPRDGAGPRDIAVLLEVESSTVIGKQELVVSYQRDVTPGQMLNFSDVLVYFDPSWDSAHPVDFRVRVMDVRSERNGRIRATLDRVESLMGSIQGLVPHSAIPGVDVAIEAATTLLSARENTVLIDFRVQFHSSAVFEGSNQADIGLLRRGSWLAVGRPTSETDAYWARPAFKQRVTDELLPGPIDESSTASGPRLEVPYVEVTISTVDVQVPKGVLDRSQQLLHLIATTGKNDSEALKESLAKLSSAVQGYVADRNLKRYRTIEDLGTVIDLLFTTATGKSDAGALTIGQRRLLTRTVRLVIGDTLFTKHYRAPVDSNEAPSAGLQRWWTAEGVHGVLVEDKAAPLGFKWCPGDEDAANN